MDKLSTAVKLHVYWYSICDWCTLQLHLWIKN